MSQTITFFRPRQSGATYSFVLKSSKARYRVFVYSPAPVDGTLVGNRNSEEIHPEMDRIVKAIGPEGILVWTEERETLRFEILTGAWEALSCGVLQPGSALTVGPLNKSQTYEVPLGTRLLIPVNRDAENRLRSLQSDLAWLPPDLEALILSAIGNPGLEVRMSRLEAKTPGIGDEAGSGWMGRLKERFGQVPLWPVALFLILLMLGLNAYLLYSLSEKIGAPKGASPAATGPQPGGGPPTGRGASSPPSPAAQKIFEVSEALRDQQYRDADLYSLYETHFSNLNTADDVASNLKKEKENQRLVLGLMKLEALRIDRAASTPLIGEMDDYRKLKDFFKKHPETQAKAVDMLIALGCDAYKVPGLPAQTSVNSLEYFVDKNKKTCKNVHLEEAMPGLDQLVAFANNPDGTT